jgi:hypothetical protein
MIRVLVICSLILAYSYTAQAAEGYFHYGVTFVLALASGWSWEEAVTIASANLAVDINEETVASLEMTDSRRWPHMARKNYRFHCFSQTNDKSASRHNDRNDDVKANLAQLEERANRSIEYAKVSQAPADSTRMLIAIGVYLHCQQDSWFHSGFGGEWDGHVLETLLAMLFQMPDPDHAAARPEKTERAVDETLERLIGFKTRKDGISRQIQHHEMITLKRLLTHAHIKKMGKRERRQCHQSLMGLWLHNVLSQRDRESEIARDHLRENLFLSPRCRVVHRQVFSEKLHQRWVQLPLEIIPRLALDGFPTQIAPDGAYERRD